MPRLLLALEALLALAAFASGADDKSLPDRERRVKVALALTAPPKRPAAPAPKPVRLVPWTYWDGHTVWIPEGQTPPPRPVWPAGPVGFAPTLPPQKCQGQV